MADPNHTTDLVTELTAEIVSAYVTKNPVPVSELPSVIASVFQSVSNLNGRQEPTVEPQKPKVSVRRSVTRDHIISLEDGKQYKTLKRHLTTLGLTPEGYRAKWSLPADYPMVAESYAEQRSELAKKLGLGRKTNPKRGGRRTVKS
ncbi:MucR family transcriptional regulator [Mesorhizobium sp. NPDC059025]|uniref:MucR family transcriptional regulator n=1 Tax=unclassified Mesorhizobium TaxID=325217 RepID=UPI0036704DBF